MLYRLQLPFTSEKGLRYGWSSASLFHGLLMDTVSPETAELLHSQTSRPLAQCVTGEQDAPVWTVCTLQKDAFTQIIEPLSKLRTAEITHRDDVLTFGTPDITQISYDDLFCKHYIREEPAKYIRIEFLTPTAFKTGGNYLNMPTARLILTGLARRYDSLCDVHETVYDSLGEEIGERVTIASYNLRSAAFPLENVRIPAFVGSLTLRISSNETFRRYVNLLCDFANYAGVGIKTALGMGHVRCTPCTEYKHSSRTT